MRTHFCPEDGDWITFEGECTWCGLKEFETTDAEFRVTPIFPDRHPSGLAWDRWYFPFKTPAEKEMVTHWLNTQKEFATTDDEFRAIMVALQANANPDINDD